MRKVILMLCAACSIAAVAAFDSLPSLAIHIDNKEFTINWVPGGGAVELSAMASRLGSLLDLDGEAHLRLKSKINELETEWWNAYAYQPDFGAGHGKPCATGKARWPANWTVDGDDEFECQALVDRSRGIALDWSPRAGSSTALAAFLSAMGYDNTRAIIRQAQRTCRRLAFMRATHTGLCPLSENESQAWLKFDFTQRGSHNAHYLRMLLNSYETLQLAHCDLDTLTIVKVVRNPFDRAVSSYRFAMQFGYLATNSSKGHTGPGLGPNASFADFLELLLIVHRSPYKSNLSGLYRETSWSAHHRPQKRLFEYDRPVNRVVRCEDVPTTEDALFTWIRVLLDDDRAPTAALESHLTPHEFYHASQLQLIDSQVAKLGWLDLVDRFGTAVPQTAAFYDFPGRSNELAVAELYEQDILTYGYTFPYDRRTFSLESQAP